MCRSRSVGSVMALSVVAVVATALAFMPLPPRADVTRMDSPMTTDVRTPFNGFARKFRVGETATQSFARGKYPMWSDCEASGVARIVPHQFSQTVAGPFRYSDNVIAQLPGTCHLVAYIVDDNQNIQGIAAVLTIEVSR